MKKYQCPIIPKSYAPRSEYVKYNIYNLYFENASNVFRSNRMG